MNRIIRLVVIVILVVILAILLFYKKDKAHNRHKSHGQGHGHDHSFNHTIPRLRLSATEDQLYLGPNTAVISSTTVGFTKYTLPDPELPACNFILSESVNAQPQAINSSLLLAGDIILKNDVDRKISHGLVASATPRTLFIIQPNGKIVLSATDGVNIPKTVASSDILFSPDSDHKIAWDGTGTSTPYSLTISGLTTTAGNGGDLIVNAGAGTSLGGNLKMDAGAGTTNGQVMIGTGATSLVTLGKTTVNGILTATSDIVFTNTVNHNIQFDAASTSTGKTITFTGNAGATGQRGGSMTFTPGTSSHNVSGQAGATLFLNGGPLSGSSNSLTVAGTLLLRGGFVPSGLGSGGLTDIQGGGTMDPLGVGGNARLLPGQNQASGDLTKAGWIQLGLPQTGTNGATFTNSILAYLDFYLLNNKFAKAYQSPLNVYSTTTHASAQFTYMGGLSTTNVRLTRIGNVVTIAFEGWQTNINSGGSGDTVTSQITLIDTIYLPSVDYKSSSIVVTNGGVTDVATVIAHTTGVLEFTKSDGTGWSTIGDQPTFGSGSITYIVIS